MSGMIVAPQPTAVEEGAKVLMRGGNAIDAAVTAAFVQFVIDPHTCSVGGYMVSNVHLAQATPDRTHAPEPRRPCLGSRHPYRS